MLEAVAMSRGFQSKGMHAVCHRASDQASQPTDVPHLQVYHELVVLELMHKRPDFSPGASLEAVTRPCLQSD